MKKRISDTKGSITVEASIVLPLLICAVLTIGMFNKVYHVYEIIHHALSETANELSAVSSIYYASGLYEIQEELDDKLEDYGAINSLSDFEDIAYWIIASSYGKGKDSFGNLIVKVLMEKYLVTGRNTNVDARLKALNIVDGWDGLDFSHSNYLNGSHDIDLVVTYQMKLPLPIQFVGEIPIIQRVTLRPWMEGSLPTDFQKGENSEGDIIFPEGLIDEIITAGFDVWKLPVFNRGREIKKILNRNLHEDFPIIDTITDNRLVSIRTHDTRLKSNHGRGFYYSLTQDIKRLDEYIEGSHEGVTIRAQDYQGKVLNVVIPYEELSSEQIKSLQDGKAHAATKNITIKITVVK